MPHLPDYSSTEFSNKLHECRVGDRIKIGGTTGVYRVCKCIQLEDRHFRLPQGWKKEIACLDETSWFILFVSDDASVCILKDD